MQDLQKKVNEQCKQMVPMVRPVFTSVLIDDKSVVSAEIPGIDITEPHAITGASGEPRALTSVRGILMSR